MSPLPLTERAMLFAFAAHAGQKYGDHAYSFHLEDVVVSLRRFGERRPAMLAAAWLHDVLEDTEVREATLRQRFGDRVADLVVAVTNEPGTRSERSAATWAKIRTAGPDAVMLKLADRIANVEAAQGSRRDLFTMYKREWPAFRAALHRDGEHEAMWAHLEKLLAD